MTKNPTKEELLAAGRVKLAAAEAAAVKQLQEEQELRNEALREMRALLAEALPALLSFTDRDGNLDGSLAELSRKIAKALHESEWLLRPAQVPTEDA